MKVKITIMPKKDVLDPKGVAVNNSLKSIGFEGVNEVRIGKVVEINLSDTLSGEDIHKRVRDMCKSLLVNSVIEDYTIEADAE